MGARWVKSVSKRYERKYNYSPKKSYIAMKTIVEIKPRVPYRWKV